MNLISSGDKNAYRQALENVHDTFSRDVYVFKTIERAVLIEKSSDFNSFYRTNAQPSLGTSEVQQTGVFPMRVFWMDPRKEENLPHSSPGYEIRDGIKGNVCRLKMREDAYMFLKDCKKIKVDDRDCELLGVSRPHGIIDNYFYTVFVKESN